MKDYLGKEILPALSFYLNNKFYPNGNFLSWETDYDGDKYG